MTFAPVPVHAQPLAQPAARQASPILPLNQVAVGAKGYGLTVFHGAKIEAFPVEVISVMRDFAPKRGVIWVRCDDPRLLQSGPVQGMSGSPIYLWDKDEPQVLGKGGKMIGAFAFGFSWTKDCYAGVQPIGMMRDTAGQIDEEKAAENIREKKSAKRQGAAGATLIDLLNYADEQGLSEEATWQATTFAKLLGLKRDGKTLTDDAQWRKLAGGPRDVEGKAMRMMLPLSVGSESMARVLTPLFAPMGIAPMQTPTGTAAGLPPPDTDAKSIELAPGSVLAIPLAFGDADMSATGTVTDVLPDGRVIGFGHPMFGQGESALPMATGYVHFVVPRLQTSFKLGGSAIIKGTILRDDAAAVAGAPTKYFRTAPVTINVTYGGRKKQYNYQVVHHERLTPSLVAAVIMQSLTADQSLPTENTLRLKGSAMFEGNRKVDFNSTMSPGIDQRMVFELVPAFAAMIQNPHGSAGLKSLELDLVVTDKIEAINILGARLDKTTVEPGEVLKITVATQPYGQPRTSQRVELKVPDSLPEGKYTVAVGDARTLNRMLMMNRPHLMNTTSLDHVHEVVKLVMGIRQDAIYTVLQLPPAGVAVGRQEMPRLPSSRRSLIVSAQDMTAMPFGDWVQVVTPQNAAVSGDAILEIEVVKGKK